MRLQHLGVLFLALSLLACDTAEEPGPAIPPGAWRLWAAW